jgi:ketosteroid isomerase-like protein
MKRLIVFFAVLSSAELWLSSARTLETRSDDSAVEQKVIQMERDWADAMMRNDPSVIERIEADDYAYVMDGMKGGKPSDVEQAQKHAYAGTAELTDMHVRVFGDTAIVTGKAALRDAKYMGKDVSGDYLFTDVFVKRNGRWQVVASHSNRVRSDM